MTHHEASLLAHVRNAGIENRIEKSSMAYPTLMRRYPAFYYYGLYLHTHPTDFNFLHLQEPVDHFLAILMRVAELNAKGSVVDEAGFYRMLETLLYHFLELETLQASIRNREVLNNSIYRKYEETFQTIFRQLELAFLSTRVLLGIKNHRVAFELDDVEFFRVMFLAIKEGV